MILKYPKIIRLLMLPGLFILFGIFSLAGYIEDGARFIAVKCHFLSEKIYGTGLWW
jgi:hypothetical protein